jgi:hypothetical protein
VVAGVAGVIASVIGAFYYLRIVYYMYFGEEGEALDRGIARTLGLSRGQRRGDGAGVVNLFGVEGARPRRRRALSTEVWPEAMTGFFSERSTARWPRRADRSGPDPAHMDLRAPPDRRAGPPGPGLGKPARQLRGHAGHAPRWRAGCGCAAVVRLPRTRCSRRWRCMRTALRWLKWPNDVLLNGGKVAGILLESTGSGGRIDWLSIGIGVNLIHSPRGVTDTAFPPVSLAEETGSRVDALEFLGTLADCLATQEAIFERLGFGQIRESWLAPNAARLGEVITARTGREDEVTRQVSKRWTRRQLVLKTAQGRVRIPAADVYF